jgi:hypothetical protein
MGRRIREHTIKIAFWQNNQLIKEEYTASNLYEALEIARNYEKYVAVNVYDILDILVYSANLEIIDLIPETKQESIEEIIEELKQEEIITDDEQIFQKQKDEYLEVEAVINLTNDELITEPKIDTFKKSEPKQPVKKTITKIDTKKVETKKTAVKKTTTKKIEQ